MNKLRVSYTLLNLYKQGKIDDMIIFYFKLAGITSPAMQIGKEFDEYTNKYVQEHKTLPPELGRTKLFTPVSQEKWECDFEDRYSLVGVPDIVDGETLYEVKTGLSKDSGDYSMDFQVSIYLLLAELLNKPIKKAIILHYNQKTKELDKSIIWNTKEERNRAMNFILTLGPEIYTFFEEHGYFTSPPNLVLDIAMEDMLV